HNETCKALYKNRDAGTEYGFVATGRLNIPPLEVLVVQAAANKLSAGENGFDCDKYVACGMLFMDIAHRARFESFLDHVKRRFLADEENSCIGGQLACSPGDLQSVQPGQSDIQQN